jgi:membrane protein DedA with SNARE-associated domain
MHYPPVLDIISIVQSLGYIGAFIISLLGTLTVIFPVPYLITIYIMGASKAYNPVLIGILGGLGATFGEYFLYVLGRGGRHLVDPNKLKNLDIMRRYLDKYGWLAIFIFAVTPLPDDILYPILGLMKYNAFYTFIACFAGKAILTGGIAYAGSLSIDILDYITGGESIIMGLAIIIITILSIVIVLKVDWSKYIRIEE